MDEMESLISKEIPQVRDQLLSSHRNLSEVADYCVQNYKDGHKSKHEVVKETKNLTTRALAAVACQIHSMASKLNTVLDIQEDKMSRLQRSLDTVSMTTEMKMHQKDAQMMKLVAREKVVPERCPIFKKDRTGARKVTKYIRRKIDFSQLDHIGKGVHVPEEPDFETTRRNHRNSASTDANTIPEGSIISRASSGTFRPSSGTFKLLKRQESDLTSVVASSLGGSIGSCPYIVRGPKGTRPRDLFEIGTSVTGTSPSNSPVSSDFDVGDSVSVVNVNRGNDVTMDLPPPPVMTGDSSDEFDLPPPPPELTTEVDWAPESFMEKMTAIYDYERQQADEINLKMGETVFVTGKNEDGWFHGVTVSGSGLFPGNYVQAA